MTHRESEEALGNITATIKRSFAESTAPGCAGPTERNRPKPIGSQSGVLPSRDTQSSSSRKTIAAGTAAADRTSKAAAIVGEPEQQYHHSSTTSQFEKVMSEMDKVFNRLLKEDLGKL